MKLHLTFCKSVILPVVLISSLSCGKDKASPEAKQLIRSYVSKSTIRYDETFRFSYNDQGKLSRASQIIPLRDDEFQYYTYNGTSPGKIVSLSPQVDGPPGIHAEIQFLYDGENLSGIEVKSVSDAFSNVSYAFTYHGGKTPSAYTMTVSGERITKPDIKTYYLSSDEKGNVTKHEGSISRNILGYDDMVNPFYKFPFLTVEYRTVRFGNTVGNTQVFVLNVERFFSPNNCVTAKQSYNESISTTITTRYTYTGTGLPDTATSIATGVNSGTATEIYTY